MSVTTVLWILAAGVTILSALLGFLANWVRDIDKKQASQAQHFAENYVRGHEIAEVKQVVSSLRAEMTHAGAELRTDLTHQVGELTKAVYQLIGKNN